jgi:hypothetical protein
VPPRSGTPPSCPAATSRSSSATTATPWSGRRPHTDAGDIYRWYDPAGHVVEQPPKPGELPELPQAWVEGLREGATDAGRLLGRPGRGRGDADRAAGRRAPGCAEIVAAATHALEEVSRVDAGSATTP